MELYEHSYKQPFNLEHAGVSGAIVLLENKSSMLLMCCTLQQLFLLFSVFFL